MKATLRIRPFQLQLITAGLLVASLITTGCSKGGAGGDVKLENDNQKASYTIGRQIGQNMRTQHVEIDVAAMAMGLREAMEGKDAQLKPEESNEAMQKFQQAVVAKQKEAADKNAKAGNDWLAQNKNRPEVKSTASGLQYEVVQEGKGPIPKATDTVKVHYTGTLIDGKKFDSSLDHGGQPAQFRVEQVIPGWREALQLMPVGSKWKIAIPSALAYGSNGAPPNIPPDSVLLFDVELLEIVPVAEHTAPSATSASHAAPEKAAKKGGKKK